MARTKQAPIALKLSRNWQIAFIVVLVGGFLVQLALVMHVYISAPYIGRGTWTYQIITWLFPLVSAVAGAVYAWRRYRLWLHRIFWAVFLALLSSSLLNLTLLVENQIRSTNHWYYTGRDPSLWLAFGWDWITMGVCFTAYCGLLAYVARRKR